MICSAGQLTAEETLVSSYLTQMWSSFAVSGKPGLGAVPWNITDPKYSKVEFIYKSIIPY